MEILHYTVRTTMGEIHSKFNPLTFLSESELSELNKIGYSGKNSKGKKMTRVDYLNGLKKYGEFSIVQIKGDRGDFAETFIFTRVIK